MLKGRALIRFTYLQLFILVSISTVNTFKKYKADFATALLNN